MAEEDLIFGKNRHMFGGIEPSNMKSFAVIQKAGSSKPTIVAELPDDTVVDGQTLCTVAGAVIRRRTDRYPVDEFDGALVRTITSSGQYDDDDAPDMAQYYAAFPYTTQGVYNRNQKNRAMNKYSQAGYVYGYDITLNESHPTLRVTYPIDVGNAGFSPASMNFTTGVFDYGDWPSEAGVMFMPRPCLMSANGQVTCYLDQDDYTKQTNGTTAPSSNYAMMEWPKIYTKRTLENGVYKFRCSDIKVDEDWDCLCNYDINNEEIDHFYTAIYPGRNNGGTIISKTGFTPSVSFNGSTFDAIRANATGIGTGWDLDLLSDRLFIIDLLVMMAKRTDLVNAYGCGVAMANTYNGEYQITGTMDKKGLFWGTNTTTSSTSPTLAQGVKVFGMEHWWGNISRILVGFLIDGDEIKVKYTSGTHDGTTVTGYNSTGDGYLTIANLANYMTMTGSYIGYIKDMLVTPAGRVPITNTGSSSTYECDHMYYFRSSATDDVRYAAVSYFSNSGTAEYGPFYIEAKERTTEKASSYGASLSYKPVKE